MSQQNTHAVMANTGHQARRARSWKPPSYSTSGYSSTSSPCSGYPNGPYVYNYNGCSGFTVYWNAVGVGCCIGSKGQPIGCPCCIYPPSEQTYLANNGLCKPSY
jgi:hypothetical protein